jgi:ubiquitin-protein ligase
MLQSFACGLYSHHSCLGGSACIWCLGLEPQLGVALPTGGGLLNSGGSHTVLRCEEHSNLPILAFISMMSPRLKRLNLDFERLQTRFATWPLVQITGTNGSPPEQYQFTYFVKSLYVAPGGDILEREQHLLEVNLSLGYPRRAPQCKMITTVFHPNFDDSTVCIGDFWAASEGLDDLVIRIGRMLTYQEYNVKSPLNGLAARWATENASLLPVDTREIAPPLPKEAVEEGAAITLPNHPEEVPVQNAGSRVGVRTPLPSGGVGAQEQANPWDDRIVIDLGASAPSQKEAVPQFLDARPSEPGKVLRLSPGLKAEELKVICKLCGQSMLLESALFGQAFQCPNCKRTHRVAEDGAGS